MRHLPVKYESGRISPVLIKDLSIARICHAITKSNFQLLIQIFPLPIDTCPSNFP